MAIPFLMHGVSTSPRWLRLSYPSRFAAVTTTRSMCKHHVSQNKIYAFSLRYFLVPSSLKAKNMIISTSSHSCLSSSHRPRSSRDIYVSISRKRIATKSHTPFFKDPSRLSPSSSSLLKQNDNELSAEELRLKRALQDYVHRRGNDSSRSAKERIDNAKYDDEELYLLENLQRAYMEMEYWEEALQIEVYKCHTYLSEGTDEYTDSIHAQGKFYLRQEDFTNSKKLYEEALKYFERTENLVQQGHVLISLAGWYFFRNQLDDALESLQRSETMLDSNPALLHKCLDNQGLIYRLRGEFHVALDKYQQALQVVVNDDSEKRSALKMHIADMHLALDDSSEALSIYQDLLIDLPTMSTMTAGLKQHQLGMRGVLLHNIGTIYVDQGKHKLALDQFVEALEAKIMAGGEHNPEVAKTLNSLGALHAGSFGEKKVALEYFQRALLIARIHAEDRENPHGDPDVINALQNISIIEQDLTGGKEKDR